MFGMSFKEFIDNIGDRLLLSHEKETELLVKLLAVAIFIDEEKTDEELVEAHKVLRIHFENLGVEDDEIKYIKQKLDDKLLSFQNDHYEYVVAKNDVFKGLKSDENNQYLIDLIKKVFKADGMDAKEEEFVRKVENR